jgi:hypothetical protein
VEIDACGAGKILLGSMYNQGKECVCAEAFEALEAATGIIPRG